MNSTPISGSTRPASGFIANILGGLSEGVSRIGAEVLPNWAAQHMIDQEKDMLYEPTNFQPRRIEPSVESPDRLPQEQAFFDINKIGTQITAGSILVIALIGIGGYYLARKYL